MGTLVQIDLGGLKTVRGFAGAAVVDAETGLMLGRLGDEEQIEISAATSRDVLRIARTLVDARPGTEDVEEVVVSVGSHYHLVRTLARTPAIFLYLRVERDEGNLGLSLRALRQAEATISV